LGLGILVFDLRHVIVEDRLLELVVKTIIKAAGFLAGVVLLIAGVIDLVALPVDLTVRTTNGVAAGGASCATTATGIAKAALVARPAGAGLAIGGAAGSAAVAGTTTAVTLRRLLCFARAAAAAGASLLHIGVGGRHPRDLAADLGILVGNGVILIERFCGRPCRRNRRAFEGGVDCCQTFIDARLAVGFLLS